MKDKKKAIDHRGLSEQKKRIVNSNDKTLSSSRKGIYCTELIESLPKYVQAECEKVISGSNNSSIVLGRDRPRTRSSGYGGLGHTQSSMIDVVVGRMGAYPKDDVHVDPNFKLDSARIYISQKTDVDENFDITAGTTEDSKAKSAIGMKADAIRIISRENMKLVAGMDDTNSQGGDIEMAKFGISLIANNDDSDIQPLPKGDNLRDCLRDIYSQIHKLNGILNGIITMQDLYNKALKEHRHLSPFKGKVTSRSPSLKYIGPKVIARHFSKSMTSLKGQRVNLLDCDTKFLKQAGQKYINSRHNKVT